MLQTDFPKGCLLTKECGMAARIDLDSILEDAGAPRLEDATLTYRCGFLLFLIFIIFALHTGTSCVTLPAGTMKARSFHYFGVISR